MYRRESVSILHTREARNRFSNNCSAYPETAQEANIVHPRDESIRDLLDVLPEVSFDSGSAFVSLRAVRKAGCADLLLSDEPNPVVDLLRGKYAADAFVGVARVEHAAADIVCIVKIAQRGAPAAQLPRVEMHCQLTGVSSPPRSRRPQRELFRELQFGNLRQLMYGDAPSVGEFRALTSIGSARMWAWWFSTRFLCSLFLHCAGLAAGRRAAKVPFSLTAMTGCSAVKPGSTSVTTEGGRVRGAMSTPSNASGSSGPSVASVAGSRLCLVVLTAIVTAAVSVRV